MQSPFKATAQHQQHNEDFNNFFKEFKTGFRQIFNEALLELGKDFQRTRPSDSLQELTALKERGLDPVAKKGIDSVEKKIKVAFILIILGWLSGELVLQKRFVDLIIQKVIHFKIFFTPNLRF